MRSFFTPAEAPAWLKGVLTSVREGMSDIWHSPLRVKDFTTAALPLAADWKQGIAYDSTLAALHYSDGASWLRLFNYNATGIGYLAGAGGVVTQITSRVTGVTLNKACGAITLVSAAGTAAWQSFTVTNSTVAATDVVIVNQKSGTDKNMTHVTNVAAGSFQISFATTGGITTEQPVFSFAIIKAVGA